MTTDRSRDDKIVSVTRTIAAAPEAIFDVLADPTRHHVIDGSGMVVAARSGTPERLGPGARFGMDMTLGPLPYRIQNTVVEFEENRRIAWRHLGGHIWRYELEPTSDGGTTVTESFEWGTAKVPFLYELVGYPKRHVTNMTKTLERLDAHLTGHDPDSTP